MLRLVQFLQLGGVRSHLTFLVLHTLHALEGPRYTIAREETTGEERRKQKTGTLPLRYRWSPHKRRAF